MQNLVVSWRDTAVFLGFAKLLLFTTVFLLRQVRKQMTKSLGMTFIQLATYPWGPFPFETHSTGGSKAVSNTETTSASH